MKRKYIHGKQKNISYSSMYNEELVIEECYKRLKEKYNKIKKKYDYELIL